MTVWTISSEHGTAGEVVAAELAERLGIPMISLEITQALAERMNVSLMNADAMERHVPGMLHDLMISGVAFGATSSELVAELQRPTTLRRITEEVIRAAANEPCIVLGRAGFAILVDHEDAVHVRLWAPAEWRIENLARSRNISVEEARREVKQQDHEREHYVHRLYQRKLSHNDQFHVRVDASRFSTEAIVRMLDAVGRDGSR
jgi:cytidylate kinase